MFIEALFITAKTWKQPKCPSVDEWIKKAVLHLHNGILCGHKKEGNVTLCNSMDRPGDHHAKLKPVRERHLPYDFIHMWNIIKK